MLINYDMSFTFTRQIKVDPQLKSNELGMGGSGSSLGELLGTALAGRIVGNLMTPSSKKKKNKDVGTEPSKNSNQKMP